MAAIEKFNGSDYQKEGTGQPGVYSSPLDRPLAAAEHVPEQSPVESFTPKLSIDAFDCDQAMMKRVQRSPEKL